MSFISDTMNNISMDKLLGAPLIAVSDTARALAKTTLSFIYQIGLDKDDSTGIVSVKNVSFRYAADYDASNNPIMCDLHIPILTIIHIPYLAITELQMNFTFEMSETLKASDSFQADAAAAMTAMGAVVGPGFAVAGGVSAGGSIGTASEKSRESNQSATYDISIKAEDLGYPEGLSRVIDLLEVSIKAIKK